MQNPERFHNNPAPSQNKINFLLSQCWRRPLVQGSWHLSCHFPHRVSRRGELKGVSSLNLSLQALLSPSREASEFIFMSAQGQGVRRESSLTNLNSKPRMRSFTKRLKLHQPLPSPSWEENRGLLGHCGARGNRQAVLCPETNVFVLLSAALWPGEVASGEPCITHCRCLASGGGNSPAFLTASARSSVSKVHPDLRGLARSVGGNKAWA